MDSLEERLIELESRLAFQDNLLEQLNHALCEQQQQLSELKDTCKLLFDKIQNMQGDHGIDPTAVEVPPHY